MDRCTSLSPKPKRSKPASKTRQATVMTEDSRDENTASHRSDVVMEEPIEVLSRSSEEESESESLESELGKY
jgi:hypothetical protein